MPRDVIVCWLILYKVYVEHYHLPPQALPPSVSFIQMTVLPFYISKLQSTKSKLVC